ARRWRSRLNARSFAVFVAVEVVKEACLLLVPIDAKVRGRKDLPELIANQVDDRLEVQLRGEALLNGVDNCQLGGALLGFLEQPLRLIEQPRVLQGHTDRQRYGEGKSHYL